jgi:hypothetical protein
MSYLKSLGWISLGIIIFITFIIILGYLIESNRSK